MKSTSKMSFILMVLSFIFLLNTCDKNNENYHKTIEIINNSDKAVYAYFDFSYPDTLALTGIPSSSEPSIYKIGSYEKNKTALWLNVYYEIIFRDRRRISSDTLMVFIMDAERIESDDILINNTVIQRYDLSLPDLQKINWILTYPPSAKMKNIKMYPPYREN